MLRNRVTQIANLGVVGSNPIISIKHGNVLECSSIGRARMYFIRFYFLFYGDMLQFGETGRSQKPLRLMTHCEFESHYPHFFGELAQWLRQGIANPSVGVTRLASSSLALSVNIKIMECQLSWQSNGLLIRGSLVRAQHTPSNIGAWCQRQHSSLQNCLSGFKSCRTCNTYVVNTMLV